MQSAGIVAGTLYVPTLDSIETLQAEGRNGITQVATLLQHIFEWTRDAASDATEMLKGETQLIEAEVRVVRRDLDAALRAAACLSRRGKHNMVWEIDAEIKRLVEAALEKFMRVCWHHTCRFQTFELDANDAAWKRAGGELANMTDDELRMCENASLTASAVESCQGEGGAFVPCAARAFCAPITSQLLTPCAPAVPLVAQARSSTSSASSLALVRRTLN